MTNYDQIQYRQRCAQTQGRIDDSLIIIASGPSLTREDAALCERSGCSLLGINNAYQICTRLDYLYACDKKWWAKHYEKVTLDCRKFSLEETPYSDVEPLTNDGFNGISHQWPKVRTGGNSGYQALNLAVILGYKNIVLLGYDMQPGEKGELHWHPNHEGLSNPNPKRLESWRGAFDSAAPVIAGRGVEVVNATRRTALTCFPRIDLEQALNDAL